MRTILVTGSDTGVGKTHVVAALCRLLSGPGQRLQIVKVVETGTGGRADFEGDARRAKRLSGADVETFTLASFALALAPVTAAREEGVTLELKSLASRLRELPECDWRIVEGAGGIATPLEASGLDWADFARVAGADSVVLVVPDRLGAINQARLAWHRLGPSPLRAGIWLNATAPVEASLAVSNREGIRSAGLPIWAEQFFGATAPSDSGQLLRYLHGADECDPASHQQPLTFLRERMIGSLAERDRKGLRRTLKVSAPSNKILNLADNDYLELARDPAVIAALRDAASVHGSSASASPLITGWREPHARLLERLAAWHGFPFGLLWTSGYAANSAILGMLPENRDLVLADRLIHNSMIAGLLRSGARLKRYAHLDLDELADLLEREQAGARQVFVVTESVFSMDGDYPDLRRLAELKRRHGFFWIVDEAHALGWYGPKGAGLVRAAGVESDVDVLVGTLGKTLASGGAYSLFRDETVRDYLMNGAGEFVYSTAFPPANAAAALAALERVTALSGAQAEWQAMSRDFRNRLRSAGWEAADGDSPVVPVRLADAASALGLAEALRKEGILVGAVRPPTVPVGTSRMRFSLKRTFGAPDASRVLQVMEDWRNAK